MSDDQNISLRWFILFIELCWWAWIIGLSRVLFPPAHRLWPFASRQPATSFAGLSTLWLSRLSWGGSPALCLLVFHPGLKHWSHATPTHPYSGEVLWPGSGVGHLSRKVCWNQYPWDVLWLKADHKPSIFPAVVCSKGWRSGRTVGKQSAWLITGYFLWACPHLGDWPPWLSLPFLVSLPFSQSCCAGIVFLINCEHENFAWSSVL